jgi:hypothetical protein
VHDFQSDPTGEDQVEIVAVVAFAEDHLVALEAHVARERGEFLDQPRRQPRHERMLG